jgi:flavin-dependent dehydrogenase
MQEIIVVIAEGQIPPDSFIARRRSGTDMTLTDGSRVAVIGAGPAGSMFSYFLLNMARTVALDVKVDLYEPRRFCHRGPAGCNHCGGVVSESLVQRLATEGITLPESVVQRGLESYTLHMDVGDVEIGTPTHERRIAAIYRGNGPRNSEPLASKSFDGFLQQLAGDNGANHIHRLVTDVTDEGERMRVECADGSSDDYDLVVLASGVNSQLEGRVAACSSQFKKPDCTKTFICEFRLGQDAIRKFLGPSMHVFLLDIPRLEFAALIPKGDYVTLALLGDDVDEELMNQFFSSEEVKNCFPGGVIPPHACHCYPRMNSGGAKPPFADRMVMIGDCGTTRLFKDGIGAAYRTAKAAARTAVFHGVSATDFETHYGPMCRQVEADNLYGRLVFGVAGLAQRARFARRGILRMTVNEQHLVDKPRRMSEVLWDLFSGSAPYRDVFLRALHPAYVADLVWNLIAGNVSRSDHKEEAVVVGEEKRHDSR